MVLMGELKELAKDCYLKVTDREVFTDICESAFGVRRQLPEAGEWKPEDIYSSEFVIC